MPKVSEDQVKGICPVCNEEVNGKGRVYHEKCKPPIIDPGGYRRIYQPGNARANSQGYVLEHLVIAEQELGRPVTKDEVVHHIDGDKLNNNPENLMLFPSRGEHTIFHRLQRCNAIHQEVINMHPDHWQKAFVAKANGDDYWEMLKEQGYSINAIWEASCIIRNVMRVFFRQQGRHKILVDELVVAAMIEALEL